MDRRYSQSRRLVIFSFTLTLTMVSTSILAFAQPGRGGEGEGEARTTSNFISAFSRSCRRRGDWEPRINGNLVMGESGMKTAFRTEIDWSELEGLYAIKISLASSAACRFEGEWNSPFSA